MTDLLAILILVALICLIIWIIARRNPQTTTCPECGADLEHDGYHGAVCPKCGYVK